MKLFARSPDGGKDSGVTGYFLVEAKSVFSIVLLRFAKGTREAYHEHAFNAVTLWLSGSVVEHQIKIGHLGFYQRKRFRAWRWKYTPRSCFHKIEALEETWAISVRGPWADRWRELRGDRLVTLTHGRREVA